ncbi:MAG: hypothetical protein ACTSPI_17560 [Candidatus Heimdallarchaeaceae archaeon]
MDFLFVLSQVETDHDLLVRVSEKVDLIYTLLANHLEHHFVYNITLLSGFIATVTAVVLYMIRFRKRKPSGLKDKEGD